MSRSGLKCTPAKPTVSSHTHVVLKYRIGNWTALEVICAQASLGEDVSTGPTGTTPAHGRDPKPQGMR